MRQLSSSTSPRRICRKRRSENRSSRRDELNYGADSLSDVINRGVTRNDDTFYRKIQRFHRHRPLYSQGYLHACVRKNRAAIESRNSTKKWFFFREKESVFSFSRSNLHFIVNYYRLHLNLSSYRIFLLEKKKNFLRREEENRKAESIYIFFIFHRQFYKIIRYWKKNTKTMILKLRTKKVCRNSDRKTVLSRYLYPILLYFFREEFSYKIHLFMKCIKFIFTENNSHFRAGVPGTPGSERSNYNRQNGHVSVGQVPQPQVSKQDTSQSEDRSLGGWLRRYQNVSCLLWNSPRYIYRGPRFNQSGAPMKHVELAIPLD